MTRIVAVLLAGCAPEWEAVECGLGTSEIDGRCEVVEAPPGPCIDGEILRNGQCRTEEPEADGLLFLPFAAGRGVRISQGFHGVLSHSGSASFALDFPAPVGTEVHAIQAGRVLSLREDSDDGCGDPSCSNLANSVVIDHGDGTFAIYAHLELDGVLVEEDEIVAGGQAIALSGNTGFSTGPHLHLEVRDIFGTSQPLRFVEFLEASEGVPFSGEAVPSQNVEEDPPGSAVWSTCPSDLFAYLGVILDPGISCSRVGDHSLLSGRVAVEGAVAQVSLFGTGGLYAACAEPGPSFEVDVAWDDLGHAGLAMFAVSAADPATCRSIRATTEGALVVVR